MEGKKFEFTAECWMLHAECWTPRAITNYDTIINVQYICLVHVWRMIQYKIGQKLFVVQISVLGFKFLLIQMLFGSINLKN